MFCRFHYYHLQNSEKLFWKSHFGPHPRKKRGKSTRETPSPNFGRGVPSLRGGVRACVRAPQQTSKTAAYQTSSTRTMKNSNTAPNLAETILSPRFLRVAAWTYGLCCVALWIALLLSFATGANRAGQGLGPDFSAFYSAAWMTHNGQAEDLYRFDKQLEVQRDLNLNAGANDFSAWVHPPHGAWLLAPLANFSPRAAYAIYSAFLLLCFAGGLLLVRQICPSLQAKEFNALWLLAMISSPVYFSISAGQNTGLMFLLQAVVLVSLARNRQAAAGFAVALGLLKPHLFLAWLPFWIAAKRPRALAIFGAGALCVVVVSMWFFGTDVFAREWRTLQSDLYQRYETEHAFKMFSWPSFWRLSLGNNAFSTILGALFALLVLARTCWLWTKSRDIVLLGALSVASVVLIVPHLPVYDLALLLIPVLVIFSRLTEHRVLDVAPLEAQPRDAARSSFVDLRLALLALILLSALGDEWARQTSFQIVVPLLTFIWWRAQKLLTSCFGS